MGPPPMPLCRSAEGNLASAPTACRSPDTCLRGHPSCHISVVPCRHGPPCRSRTHRRGPPGRDSQPVDRDRARRGDRRRVDRRVGAAGGPRRSPGGLDGVRMDPPPAQRISIQGISGSGKTTTGRGDCLGGGRRQACREYASTRSSDNGKGITRRPADQSRARSSSVSSASYWPVALRAHRTATTPTAMTIGVSSVGPVTASASAISASSNHRRQHRRRSSRCRTSSDRSRRRPRSSPRPRSRSRPRSGSPVTVVAPSAAPADGRRQDRS